MGGRRKGGKAAPVVGLSLSTPAYWPSLELFGWREKGQQLLDMTRAVPGRACRILLPIKCWKSLSRATYKDIADVYRSVTRDCRTE